MPSTRSPTFTSERSPPHEPAETTTAGSKSSSTALRADAALTSPIPVRTRSTGRPSSSSAYVSAVPIGWGAVHLAVAASRNGAASSGMATNTAGAPTHAAKDAASSLTA